MSILTLKQLKAGMVVASDVEDLSGRVLLKKGSEIEQKHLKIFKAWGITEINISDGESIDLDQSLEEEKNWDPKVFQQVKDELSGLFRYMDKNNPVTQELFNQCVQRKMNNPGSL